ncbi:MAG: FAD-binding oxidoreductase [Deltaproteobacteria bacterium]|nr:FAD-binding oxidoreductase [Deltaproteobacteria bacterium]
MRPTPQGPLFSYGRLQTARPRVIEHAHTVGEVSAALRRAHQEHRRVTLRAGGRSFDAQALTDDTLVQLDGFADIAIDANARTVTCGSGARWGDVVGHALGHELIPHISVTTPHATAGGVLAANCLSRSTPVYGHSGDRIRSFQLLTVDGRLLTCSRTQNADLFRAAIGGFGWLGFVTQLTIDLLPLGPRRRVKTELERQEGLESYLETLFARSHDPQGADAVYSVFSLDDRPRGAVMRSRYTEEDGPRSLFLYQKYAWHRPLGELLFATRLSRTLCQQAWTHLFPRGPFFDDLHGYTFCMEPNERAKAATERWGLTIGTLQHSYVVPEAAALGFLVECRKLMRKHDVYPSLLDGLRMPVDEALLGSARAMEGVCFSFVFQSLRRARMARVAECLRELNDACIASGGRLHLVKNVVASGEQLARMYGSALGEFAELKGRVDPRGVLGNAFGDRLFNGRGAGALDRVA